MPVDHGAQNAISGVSFDGSGLVLVRPGTAANGASDGVAYFSPDGRTWQYAGTIDPAGGWSPDGVKGSDYGFVVTGSANGKYVAYTSTGAGARWLPTGPLGGRSNGPDFNPAAGPGGRVVAAGNTNSTRTGQEGLLIKADTAGNLEPVSLSAIPGGLVPEETVQGTAVAGSVQIAVGSANGYPAVWRRVSGGPWSLVSRLADVSTDQDLGGLATITHGPNGWLATGPGGFTLTSADGSTWQPSATITHDLAGVTAVQAASGPRGYVIAGTVSGAGGVHTRDVWWSQDLASWTRAQDVGGTSGSNQVLAVAAGPSGFVSAGARDDQPAVWTTPDGRTWTAVSVPLPSGASGGVIQQVAVSGKNVVALGRQATARGIQPLAARSGDGGQTWQVVPFSAPGPGISFTALTAGPGGFTAAARFGLADGSSRCRRLVLHGRRELVAVAGQRPDWRRQPRRCRTGRLRLRGDRHRRGAGPGEPAVRRPEPSGQVTAADLFPADTVGMTRTFRAGLPRCRHDPSGGEARWLARLFGLMTRQGSGTTG